MSKAEKESKRLLRGMATRFGEKYWAFGNCLIQYTVIGKTKWCLIPNEYTDFDWCEDRTDIDICTLSEWTGEKDCNGRYIYEGDIVNLHFNKNNKPDKQEIVEEVGTIEGIDQYGGFRWHGITATVVGNIYEDVK